MMFMKFDSHLYEFSYITRLAKLCARYSFRSHHLIIYSVANALHVIPLHAILKELCHGLCILKKLA